MNLKATLLRLNTKQHRGCTRWHYDEVNGLVSGSKGCPDFTLEEAEAVAFYVPPKAQPVGGELLRHNVEHFTYRNLRCEIWQEGNGQWRAQHLDDTPSCHWHPAQPADRRDQVVRQLEAQVNAWYAAQASRVRLARSHG